MCNKGNPSTTSSQSGTSTTSQSGTSAGQQASTSSSALGPTPETLALYMQLLNQAQGVADPANFNPNTLVQTAPWTDAMNQAVNAQWALGQQGMGFVPQAAGMIAQGGQSTIPQIPGVAASLLSPWAGQAVDFGTTQGQAIGDWATGQAQNIMSQGPQLQQFSQAAIDQYQSPYTQDVVNATQAQFNNQNAIQGNQLIGQGIKQGNVFGGDRAGVAQGVLANQQQLAQAPVIAGLYNQGYAQALQEFNTQNQLAAQLQEFGANLGLQGLTTQGQLGMQGLGLGLNASTAANQQAIAALGQNQQAALQAGQLFGNLGATQFQQNLAGGQQAIGAAGVYPAWLQQVMNQQAANAGAISAYPFQTTSWYGGLLGGLGPLTGSQQAGSNASANQQQQNTIANQIANQSGITTAPQANQFVQAAGLGLAGLGLFMKDGGGVPHMASGGATPYGGQGAPYSSARSYIPDSKIPLGHLTAPPSAADKPITWQSLDRALTFMNLGGTKAATAAGAGANTGTLGQLGSLINSQAAKGAAGSLSSFFGGGNSVVNVSDPADITNVQDLKRGGMVNRFADGGGWNDEEGLDWNNQEQRNLLTNIQDFEDQQDIPTNAQYTEGQIDDETPLPRRRPAEAGPSALDFTSDEPYNVSSPEQLAEARTTDNNTLRLERSLGEMAGGAPAKTAAAPGFGGTPQAGLTQGRGRWEEPIPGIPPRSQPGLLQRWAANPLTQIGLGLASQNSPTALGGLGQGLAKAMPMIQQQRAADLKQEALDQQHQVDNSGETQRIRFADGRVWDTGLPTMKALQMQQPKVQKTRNPDTGEDEWVKIYPDGRIEPAEVSGQEKKPVAKGDTNLHGQEYLQSLIDAGDAQKAKIIEQIGNYDLDPTKTESMWRGSRKRLMEQVLQYNPDYSQPWYGAGAKSLQEFLTGGNASPAGQLVAANTAVAHAGAMSDALEDLKKMPGFLEGVSKSGIPFLSYITERARQASVRGTPEGDALNRYLTASRLYASEVSRMYVGGVGAEADRSIMQGPLDPALSYRELTGAIQQSAKMLKGRTDSLDERREAAMSGPGLLKYSRKAIEVIDPATGEVTKRLPLSDIPALKQRATDALKRIDERAKEAGGGTRAKESSGGVARPQSRADYDALPSGARYIGKDGQERIKK